MDRKPNKEFGKRGPIAPQPSVPPKRSRHVALLLMGTVAVGGGAYAMMPRETCQPSAPGVAGTPGAAPVTAGTACSPRSSSTWSTGYSRWHQPWSRTSFFSSSSFSSHHVSSSSSSHSGSGGVTRGGFGSFAHAFSAHFSGGG